MSGVYNMAIKVGGSSDFKVKSVSGSIRLNQGQAAGIIATITPPAGQKVRLLTAGVIGDLAQPDLSISVGGVSVINSLDLGTSDLAGAFTIGGTVDSRTGTFTGCRLDFLQGDTDEAIVISVAAISVRNVIYGYAFGE